jgi:dTDP-4-dehydrorhamnose 3,5-epimerase
MIEGVKVKKLEKILDERGYIAHFMRADDPDFQQFGEVYFAAAFPGAIKGWHIHKKMTLNYVCVVGNAKVVLYDHRPDSPTKGTIEEYFIGEDNHSRLTIPPGVANAWTPIGGQKAVLANCATESHTPGEMDRIDPFAYNLIPYRWGIKHG